MSIYAQSNIIFVDKTNVREKPSLKSKIIGTLQANSIVDIQNRWSKEDSIGGHSAYWMQIKYKDKTAYIWGRTVAFSRFRSQLNIENTFLIGYLPKDKIEIKVFNGRGLQIYDYQYKFLEPTNYYSVYDIGTTYNSEGCEIVSIKNDSSSIELFAWDGNKIKKTSIKLDEEKYIRGPQPRIYKKIKEFDFCIAKDSLAEMRISTDTNSEILNTFNKFDSIKVLNEHIVGNKIGHRRQIWTYVEYNGKAGYILKKHVSIPWYYIKSNKEKGLAFLYTPGAFYVYKNEKIIQQLLIRENYHVEYIYELGNLGLGNEHQFIGAYITCYIEGCDMGIDIFLWKDKKLKYIGFDGGWGDIGEWEDYELSFPIETGVKNQIARNNTYYVEYPYPIEDSLREKSKAFIVKSHKKFLRLQNDTLVEVPSKYSRIQEFVKENYPKYKLKHGTYGDINQDGIEDALYFITKEYLDSNEGYYKVSKAIVAIAFGNADSSYYLFSANSSIVDTKFQAVDFEINNNNISISVIYTMVEYGNYTTKFSKYQFQYNGNDSTIVWKSITEGKTKDADYNDYNTPWEINTKKFRETRVLFDKAWSNHSFLEGKDY